MLSLSHSGYGYSKRRCESVARWFVAKYLPRHTIDLHVEHKGLVREQVYGWMWNVPPDSRPRDFEMELRHSMKPKLYIETLLHELWHLYQHVKGNLKDKYGKRYWKGVDYSETDYEDQPWEKEAHKMENKLYKEYQKDIKSGIMTTLYDPHDDPFGGY